MLKPRTAFACLLLWLLPVGLLSADPSLWRSEWPRTDFSRTAVEYAQILSGGPPKDGIPAIDSPKFTGMSDVESLSATEPVISLEIDGDARAYPLRVLIWHEIVNDEVGGVPVAVTYCPLCDAAVVFDRRVDGRLLDFGTTGKLRNSDLIMYDRQTESWWQQFTGEAIVGKLTGTRLDMVPSRVESFARFRERFPDGQVLIPSSPGARAYGRTPYAGYDHSRMPFLYQGDLPAGIAPMARVIAVGTEAWSLDMIRDKGQLTVGDLRFEWQSGLNSALDTDLISQGRDIGYVVVRRRQDDGSWRDAVHDVTFAFAFHAFHPDGIIHME